MTQLLKMEDVALILGVSKGRAYELARNEIIPTVRMGRQVRVDKDQLFDWIQKGGKSFNDGWKKEA